jgi:peroxiredoxin
LTEITLSSYRGKSNVVLLFFPLANSGACEKELCGVRDGLGQYEELNAQVLAVSVDSHFALQMWFDKHNFKFPLLSDFNKEVSAEYDALYEVFVPGKFDYKGVAKRSAFVIDKEGVVRYAEVLENALEEPDFDKIKEVLETLN